MVPLVVFYLHIIAIVAIFTKRYQAEGIGEGFLGVFFMGLIFFVGWAMASFIMKLLLQEGLATWFDRDAASLLLLTIAEGVLYYFYFKDEGREEVSDGETSTANR